METNEQRFDESCDLAALVAEVARGNHRAFTLLYRRTWNHVFAVVHRTLVDLSQSEEVAQEVFLEVWQTASRFTVERSSVTTWLAKMARGRAIDRVRSVQASRRRENAEWARSQPVLADETLDFVTERFDQRQLAAAMNSLSRLQREALVATYLEGHTVVGAAARLGASESAMKTRMRDAVIKLRASWPTEQAA